MQTRKIFCCGCKKDVNAKKVMGDIIYPHRPDLQLKVFWRCQCGNYVGSHKGTSKPLGCIPTPEVRAARSRVHTVLDPLWKSRMFGRAYLYREISNRLGYEYHSGDIRSEAEANLVIKIIHQIKQAECA